MIDTNKKKGFTLIELLVAMAIIGVLSAIIVQSLMSVRIKARDTQRTVEVNSIKTALSAYYNGVNGAYPSIGTDGLGYPWSGLSTTLLPTYIKSIPVDPLGASWHTYTYVRGPIGTNSFGILVRYEKTGLFCKTGVNINPGWWGAVTPVCP